MRPPKSSYHTLNLRPAREKAIQHLGESKFKLPANETKALTPVPAEKKARLHLGMCTAALSSALHEYEPNRDHD